METALAGRFVGVFSDGGRDYDVNLVVPPERIRDDKTLATLPLVTPNGSPVVARPTSSPRCASLPRRPSRSRRR